MSESWSIAVHGGARTLSPSAFQANRKGCRAAAEIGAAILREGGYAVDAAEEAVRYLEDDQTFNAGSGSVPTSAGVVEVDAAIMDGATLAVGAVAALVGVRNPVGVARLLLTEPAVFLVGPGAQAFAAAHGIALEDVSPAVRGDAQHDTVGCVAFDRHGSVAAATSTGGLPHQMPGRVGDAPIPGCGFYADNLAGAVAISGDGESIVRVRLASRVMDTLTHEPVSIAVADALRQLARTGGEAGLIAIDRHGHIGIAHNSDHFAVAIAGHWLPDIVAGVHQKDFEKVNLHG